VGSALTPYVDVIDVGHGSCVLVRSNVASTLVDTGPGVQVLEYLEREKITGLTNVVISHADSDHISGLIRLLDAGFPIEDVYLNADAIKGSREWESLRFSLEDRQLSGEVRTNAAVSGGSVIDCGDLLVLEVIAPLLGDVLAGVGGMSLEGKVFEPNSMSVVLRLRAGESGLMFIPGDLDAIGFVAMNRVQRDLSAKVLVAPHHGGLMGSPAKTRETIRSLCRMIEPDTLVVSNGRGRYGNPRDVVIGGAREVRPEIYVACTQLSEGCAPTIPSASRSDLLSAYSAGAVRGLCCAGTLRFSVESTGLHRDSTGHKSFVNLVPLAQCRVPRAVT
jgi:beta-lactamase superfamily II metal-dependent hydrolase